MMKIQRFRKVDIESTGDTDKQHEDSYGKKGNTQRDKNCCLYNCLCHPLS